MQRTSQFHAMDCVYLYLYICVFVHACVCSHVMQTQTNAVNHGSGGADGRYTSGMYSCIETISPSTCTRCSKDQRFPRHVHVLLVFKQDICLNLESSNSNRTLTAAACGYVFNCQFPCRTFLVCIILHFLSLFFSLFFSSILNFIDCTI